MAILAFDNNRKKVRFPQRLQAAVKVCDHMKKPMLENRNEILSRYAAGYYQGRTSVSARPMNMIWRYCQVITPFLVSNNPKVMIEPRSTQLSQFSFIFSLAVNDLLEKINFSKKMRSIVFNSLNSIGVSKTGMYPGWTYELSGVKYPAGQPYVEPIEFSDFVFDVAARDYDELSFIGNHYRVRSDFVRDSGLFKNYDKLKLATSLYDNKRVEEISKPSGKTYNYNELHEYVNLIDIYLPEEGTLITIARDGEGDRILRETDAIPEGGPYDILQYNTFPDTILPIPPAYALLDLDDMLNSLVKKIKRQTEREKEILVYEDKGEDDAGRVVGSGDGDAVRVSDISAMQSVRFGGTNDRALNVAQWLRGNVSEAGGNLDNLGGLRSEADTLGQENMIHANATRVVDDMVWQVYSFTQSITKKLAWHLWSDPLIEIPMTTEKVGPVPIDIIYSSEAKEGEFLDYNFEIVPFSMQRMNPGMSYQKLLQLVAEIIMPTAELGMQQGNTLDVAELVKVASQYLDVKGIDKIYKVESNIMNDIGLGKVAPARGVPVPAVVPDRRMGQGKVDPMAKIESKDDGNQGFRGREK